MIRNGRYKRMLKGVNRQVVEIAQPESKYFEKIILFVRPEFSGWPEARLAAQAVLDLPGDAAPPKNAKKRLMIRVRSLIRAGLCAGAGAGLLALAELILR